MRGDTATVTTGEPIDQTLAALLKRNPRNKMAFEYLMACYLVTGQVDKIVANVGKLREFGYERIPPLYEEAILIYYGSWRQHGGRGQVQHSPETIRRYFPQPGNAQSLRIAKPCSIV
jgi:hypothetical protein